MSIALQFAMNHELSTLDVTAAAAQLDRRPDLLQIINTLVSRIVDT